MLLNVARDGIQVAGALHARGLAPTMERGARGGHGLIDLRLPGLDRLAEQLAVGWIVAGEVFGALGRDPLVIDEQAELAAMLLEPGLHSRRGLRRRAVVHGFENIE